MSIMAFLPRLIVTVTMLGLAISAEKEWWQTMSLYQIYPRSYMDSDGDGVGDLKGISSKLDHLKDSNVDAFWLSPFYPSPMVDFGYDISNFVDVDPIYGTLEDFENLVKQAHASDIKVIVDLVPNHSSDKHEWFQKSVKNIKPYSDFYVWMNGTIQDDGSIGKPNNWVSVFGGPAWTWNDERKAYYFHQFAPEQPDLNYENEEVAREIKNVMRFWLDKGVDGFRIDAVPHLCEDQRLLNEPLTGNTDDVNNYGYVDHIYTKDQPKTYDIVKQWREVLDEYKTKDGASRVMMIEAYTDTPLTMKYYKYGAHFPFNFWLINSVNKDSSAADFKSVVDRWMSEMPEGGTANWVAGNHDQPRLVTRYGTRLAQMVTIMTLLLPGVGVTYLGDEIGMENTFISWEDTKDPPGCNAGIDGYESASRDPERTPFQWDNSTSAGFSTNPHTWLPVNPNYLELNLAAEKLQSDSVFKMYRDVSALRKWPAVREGSLTTRLINDDVFAFSRQELGQRSVYVIFNFKNEAQVVDLNVFEHVPNVLAVYRSTYQHDSLLVPGNRTIFLRAISAKQSSRLCATMRPRRRILFKSSSASSRRSDLRYSANSVVASTMKGPPRDIANNLQLVLLTNDYE